MLIQPFVENAVKHGLSHKDGDKMLLITFEEESDSILRVYIEDNGIGRNQSAKINANLGDAHVSMGMKITGDRLLLLKERNATIAVEDLINDNGEACGTRVLLRIPIEN